MNPVIAEFHRQIFADLFEHRFYLTTVFYRVFHTSRTNPAGIFQRFDPAGHRTKITSGQLTALYTVKCLASVDIFSGDTAGTKHPGTGGTLQTFIHALLTAIDIIPYLYSLFHAWLFTYPALRHDLRQTLPGTEIALFRM